MVGIVYGIELEIEYVEVNEINSTNTKLGFQLKFPSSF